MAAEWRTATIKEVAEKVGIGPFGSSIKVETFVDEGIPVISGQHLHGTRLEDGEYNFITVDHAEKLRNANVFRGDVIFTHAGNIGQAAYIPETSKYERYIISQRQFYMRCDRTKIMPGFVTRYFKTAEGRHKLLANASPVGVPSLAQPVTYLRTIEIPVPPLHEQEAITQIFDALDDKIELNRRMNETLEALARALFRSWFVDAAQAGLPKGWREGKLRDCCERVENGGTPRRDEPRYWIPATIPWLTSGEVRQAIVTKTENLISEDGLMNSSAKLWPAATTVVALYGATAGQVCFLGDTMCSNQACCGLIPKKEMRYYVYLHASSSVAALEQQSRGSAQQNLSQQIVADFLNTIPDGENLAKFDKNVHPLFLKWIANLNESRTHAALRDALLPKLLSGELRVPAAAKLVEAQA